MLKVEKISRHLNINDTAGSFTHVRCMHKRFAQKVRILITLRFFMFVLQRNLEVKSQHRLTFVTIGKLYLAILQR